MSITPFQIYLWQQLDTIHSQLFSLHLPIILLSLLGVFALAMFHDVDWASSDTKSAIRKKVWNTYKFFVFPYLIITQLISIFLPTSKTVAMMIAIPAIIDSKPVQKDLPDVYNMALEALKNQINSKKETK